MLSVLLALLLSVHTGWVTSWTVTAHILFAGAMVIAICVIARGILEHVQGALRARDLEPVAETWAMKIDRVVGGMLGLLCASLICLAAACLGSTIVFNATVSREGASQSAEDPAPPPAWIDSLGEACLAATEISNEALIRHVPYLSEYGREMGCLVKILNSPRWKLQLIVHKRGLYEFMEIPEVQEALLDSEYRTLLTRSRRGDPAALYRLLESPITHELLTCPGIREFAARIRPSDLVEDMNGARNESSQVEAGLEEEYRAYVAEIGRVLSARLRARTQRGDGKRLAGHAD